MAKPNFQFEKRQRELAKKQKNEEKQRRKLERDATPPEAEARTDLPESVPTEPTSS